MFCEKCGEQVNNDVKFCPNCGVSMYNSNPTNNTKKQKITFVEKIKKAKLPIIISTILLIILIVVISIIAFFNERISVDKYINYENITVTGYNGYGTMDYENLIDYDRLANDLGDYKFEGHWLNDEVALDGIDEFLKNNIVISISDAEKDKHWSNNDEYAVKIKINYDYINKYNFDKKLVGSKDGYSKSFTITGLKEPLKIDPFEMIKSVNYDLTNSGTEIIFDKKYEKIYDNYKVKYKEENYGNYFVVIDPDGNEIIETEFSCFPYDYESENKKTLTVNALPSNFLDDYGIIMPSEKEYKPTEIDFLTDVSKLSKKDYDAIKEQATQYVKDSEKSDSKYVTSFFISSEYSMHHNGIVFVYSDSINGNTQYKYLAYDNIKIDRSNNTVTNINDLVLDKSFFSSDSIESLKHDFPNHKISPINF